MFNYKYLIKLQFRMIYYLNSFVGYNAIKHYLRLLHELLRFTECKIKIFDDEMDNVYNIIKSLNNIIDRSLDSDIVEVLDVNKIIYAMNTTQKIANETSFIIYKIIESMKYLLQYMMKYGKTYSDHIVCVENSTSEAESTSNLIHDDCIETNQVCDNAIMYASDDYEVAIVKAFDAIAKTSHGINHMNSVLNISFSVVKEVEYMLEKISLDIIKYYPVQ